MKNALSNKNTTFIGILILVMGFIPGSIALFNSPLIEQPFLEWWDELGVLVVEVLAAFGLFAAADSANVEVKQ